MLNTFAGFGVDVVDEYPKVYMMCLVQRIDRSQKIQFESMLCDTFSNSQISPDDDDNNGMGNVQCVTLNTCIRPLKVH